MQGIFQSGLPSASKTIATPLATKDGKLAGGLKIDQPEKFWEPSKFLIIVKG